MAFYQKEMGEVNRVSAAVISSYDVTVESSLLSTIVSLRKERSPESEITLNGQTESTQKLF